MNSSELEITNGTAQRFSRLYNPGEIKAQTWYSTHGDETNIAHSSGIFIQMIWKPSIGSISARSGGLTPRFSSAVCGRLPDNVPELRPDAQANRERHAHSAERLQQARSGAPQGDP